jgi:hypothetical protein
MLIGAAILAELQARPACFLGPGLDLADSPIHAPPIVHLAAPSPCSSTGLPSGEGVPTRLPVRVGPTTFGL